ncbi:MAG: ABC transporter permease [Pseudonocardiales bacterium]
MSAPGVLQYRSLIWNFAQRDLKSRFKGTAIGWTWSLLLPLTTLAVYTLVGKLFNIPPARFADGRPGNFAVWLVVGLTAWGFFANAVNVSMGALLGSGTLLQKIYFPSFAPVVGAVIGVVIQSAIEVGLVLVALVFFSNVGVTWLLLPVWIAVFILFTTSAALLFAIGNIYFRDLAHIVAVVLQLLFYATPILYPDTIGPLVKHPLLHNLILCNPMTDFVLLFRDLVYGLDPGRLNIWAGALGWTAFMFGFAMFVFNRYGRDLAEQM